MQQFIVSLEKMAADSVWAGKNRFDSFAPIRLNVAAQWLVDGRDYLWNLSRALLLAKRTVYIHDWWLSPELYMRRPTQEKYRLDNILKKKAEEGVQIYVIVYNEVSNKTTPTDSLCVGSTPHIVCRLFELTFFPTCASAGTPRRRCAISTPTSTSSARRATSRPALSTGHITRRCASSTR